MTAPVPTTDPNAPSSSSSPSTPRAFKYVVVGAGNAAGYVARHFVESGSLEPDELCLIGDEPHLPYERPALSKAVLFNSKVRLPGFNTCVGGGGDRQTEDFYTEHGITTLLSTRVDRIDARMRTVTLEGSGDTVQATNALIVATGALPIRLDALHGSKLEGIHYIRKYEEALDLVADLTPDSKNKKVVVLGGGYIGMEASAAAATVGCASVTVAFPESDIMPRMFPSALAAPYEELYESKGVVFAKGVIAKQFNGDAASGGVSGVVVQDIDTGVLRTLLADIVIVGVGAKPDTGLLMGQVAMDERGGVMVNSDLRTTMHGVYAIGDIASFPLKRYGRRDRMEHVTNARKQASHVVDVVTRAKGNGAGGYEYDYLPFFYSRVFHMSWQFYGDNPAPPEAKCVLCGGMMTGEELAKWESEEKSGPHPQALVVWIESDRSRLVGVFMESPTEEQSEQMRKVADEKPVVDDKKLSACKSVEEGWDVILAKTVSYSAPRLA